eukprot:SAG11_NODE_99_length_16913_cov_41.552813_6_plen_160_part_00
MCGTKRPRFGLVSEDKPRWCAPCAKGVEGELKDFGELVSGRACYDLPNGSDSDGKQLGVREAITVEDLHKTAVARIRKVYHELGWSTEEQQRDWLKEKFDELNITNVEITALRLCTCATFTCFCCHAKLSVIFPFIRSTVTCTVLAVVVLADTGPMFML